MLWELPRGNLRWSVLGLTLESCSQRTVDSMTMPATQPVDYVAFLRFEADNTSSTDERFTSLADQLTALREIRKGCGSWSGLTRCGYRLGLDRTVYLCGVCAIKSCAIQDRLTATDQGES
jgi:hypothetical protein